MLALYRAIVKTVKAITPIQSHQRVRRAEERLETVRVPDLCSGKLSSTFRRHNTGRWEWEDAQPIAAAFEVCQSWSASKFHSDSRIASTGGSRSRAITIREAVTAYLANREGSKMSPDTLRKYRTFTKQLSAFRESRGSAPEYSRITDDEIKAIMSRPSIVCTAYCG